MHLVALNGLGVSVAPLNPAMQASDLGQALADADLSLIVAWEDHHAVLYEALKTSGTNVAFGLPDGENFPPAHTVPQEGMIGAKTEAAMLFTSGSTGRPKACRLSNEWFAWIGEHYANIGGYCAFNDGTDRILTPLPVTHMNALACSFLVAMRYGACLIQLDRFHASTWWRTVRETGATVVHYLGVMPAILLQTPASAADREGLTVRFGFGAGVDPRHHIVFEERFGFPLIEAWAMTETGAAAWITASQEPRHVGQRCFGRAPEHLDYRIVDDNGSDVDPGLPGELLVRMKGDDPRRFFFLDYYKAPEATEAMWDGGWFHTGDVVRQDDEGSFYFVDRNKNIIRRSGENIAAVEIEGVLLQHPAVAGCAVLPIEDEIRGEEVMALVQLKGTDASEPAARELFDFVSANLVYFKAPGYVAFVEALPTTDSQKLQRGMVRALGRQLHGEGKAFDFRPLKSKRKAA
jgi:acyl-coenzyme A synthetase/AMP-(fatty) acid ligase